MNDSTMVPFGEGYEATRDGFKPRHPAEEKLRYLLAMAQDHQGSLYGDDGELQDNRWPMIDFRRDSVEEIERKMTMRGLKGAVECGFAKSPGWKLVPVEPTKEMIDAGFNTVTNRLYPDIYKAMVNAAPEFTFDLRLPATA